MTADRRSTPQRSNDSGVSIVIIAAGMVFILAMAGLGIDLASFYVGRSQAQRAADAAALAGARAFMQAGCVTGSGGTGLTPVCMAVAKQQAEAVGKNNLIAGVTPDIKDADITFPNQSSSNPEIQVVVGRGTYDGIDHDNAMPTFFLKIFGIKTASVSAMATAEAYNPSGTTGSISATCVKPWIFPNCDQFNNTDTSPYCGSGIGPFVKPDGSGGFYVARPINYPAGAIGEPYVIKPGSPGATPVPGQYFAAYIPNATATPTDCPACAFITSGGGSGSGSAATYRENISCCNTNPVVCGTSLELESTLQGNPGNMAGPTAQGVDCLIHQDENADGSNGSSCGQDYVSGLTSNCTNPPSSLASDMPLLPAIPPAIMPGANNPYDPGGNSPITYSASDSVIVVPMYNGVIQSGQTSVTVVGFLQLFIRDVTTSGNPKGTVYSYVINISACGSSGTGPTGSGPVAADGGSAIPIRLIHQ